MADRSIHQVGPVTIESTGDGVFIRSATGQVVLSGPEVQLTYQDGPTVGVSLLVNQNGVVTLQPLYFLNLPAVDPHVAGRVWSNNGILMVSQG